MQRARDWIAARRDGPVAASTPCCRPRCRSWRPPIAEVAPGAERDEAFFRINALLLRNTSVVNMLDGCAISLPCQRPANCRSASWSGTARCATTRSSTSRCRSKQRSLACDSDRATAAMKIAIVGAGIIGVTTAYELAADGHEVTVFERRGAVAEETSFANAGVVAPGYVTPWAAPGMPAKVRALPVQPPRAGARVAGRCRAHEHRAGCGAGGSACDLATYLANRARMQRLAFYSRTRLHELTEDLQLEYDRSQRLHGAAARREGPQAGAARPAGAARRRRDVPARSTPTQARAIEPALNPDTAFPGAIHLPDDEVGNCRQFALLLEDAGRRRCGVQLRVQLRRWRRWIRPRRHRAASGTLGDDAPRAAALRRRGGLRRRRLGARCCGRWACSMPLAAVHGYSISAPIREPLERAAQRA